MQLYITSAQWGGEGLHIKILENEGKTLLVLILFNLGIKSGLEHIFILLVLNYGGCAIYAIGIFVKNVCSL